MRRQRIFLIVAVLLVIWLAFGSQIIERVSTLLVPTEGEGLPVGVELNGRLFYTQGFDGIWQLDLNSGDVSQWWQPPDDGLVTGIDVSPDGSRLALAYAPPAEEGFQVGTTDLYLSPSDRPDPQPLLVREHRNESYRSPSWSPDGQWLYFSHQKPVVNNEGETEAIELSGERIAPDDGPTPELVLEDAEQPVLSPDGQQIVYVQLDTVTYAQGVWVVNHDGSDRREMVTAGVFRVINSPLFTPDGQSIVFSASGGSEGEVTARSGGVSVAWAHGEPWNIWQVSLDDGVMTKLTPTALDGPWMTWSPDGAHMVVIAADGVFLVNKGKFYRLAEVTSEGEIAWVK